MFRPYISLPFFPSFLFPLLIYLLNLLPSRIQDVLLKDVTSYKVLETQWRTQPSQDHYRHLFLDTVGMLPPSTPSHLPPSRTYLFSLYTRSFVVQFQLLNALVTNTISLRDLGVL